jgi:ribonuclease H2 subunit C
MPLTDNPISSPIDTRTAYFRGRKLHGTAVKLPSDYRGVVIEHREESTSQPRGGDLEGEQGESGEEQQAQEGSMESKAEFDELVIWGHESIADATTDPYLRGMSEWVQLAEQVCVLCTFKYHLPS